MTSIEPNRPAFNSHHLQSFAGEFLEAAERAGQFELRGNQAVVGTIFPGQPPIFIRRFTAAIVLLAGISGKNLAVAS